jgi:hypothetical protein
MSARKPRTTSFIQGSGKWPSGALQCGGSAAGELPQIFAAATAIGTILTVHTDEYLSDNLSLPGRVDGIPAGANPQPHHPLGASSS